MDENPFAAWPHAVLQSAHLSCVVLLPDPLQGYYRGPRFDWSGTVASVRRNGHAWFGPWRTLPHSPRVHDDTAGTAGEFGMGPLTDNPPPIGYEDAAVGEQFLKIGVGRLSKIEEAAYNFSALYRIARPAAWDVRREEAEISFTQEDGPVRGHAFRYSRRIALSSSDPSLSSSHTLTNTGLRPLRQTHYCHNFVCFDGEHVGRDVSLELPFAPVLSQVRGSALSTEGRRITLVRDPGPDEEFFGLVSGFSGRAAENQVLVRSPRASLRITGDSPMARLQVWGNGRTICPEPFVALDLAPGETAAWTIRYDFLEGA
jgi:hypothetical protein